MDKQEWLDGKRVIDEKYRLKVEELREDMDGREGENKWIVYDDYRIEKRVHNFVRKRSELEERCKAEQWKLYDEYRLQPETREVV